MYKESFNQPLSAPSLHLVEAAGREVLHVVKWMDPRYAGLLRQFHELRKQVFVDALKWNLAVSDGMEWDQYDTPRATYILIERDGRCVGGARLLRCDGRHMVGGIEYSYMLRDAHLGLLPTFPRTVITDPPTGADEWEMTRVVTERSPRQFKAIWHAVNDFVISQNGRRCTIISRPSVLRLASIWGFEIEQMGPLTQIADDTWLALRFTRL